MLMDKRILIIIGAVVLLLILLFAGLAIGGVFSGGAGTGEEAGNNSRDNKLALARDYLSRNEFDRALDLVDQVLLDNFNDEEARALKDEILEKKKAAQDAERADQLRRERTQALSDDSSRERYTNRTNVTIPDDASSAERERLRKIQDLLNKGDSYRESKQYDRAQDAYNEVLKLDPDSAEANARIGATWLEEDPTNKNNLDKAKEYSLKAIEEDPKLALPHKTLAEIYEQNKQYDNAEREWKEATRLDPQDWWALYKLGNVQYRLGKYADAVRSYNSCIHLKSDFYNAYFNKGLAHTKLSQRDQAIEALVSVTRLKPDFARNYYQLGLLYYEKRDFQ
ncbi:MAG TPA: tetratricopeptide repeat protein, partial [Spirochaetia bacterium]|nr:tetratricopeptide repeat protein [Spirochaetia bacterium]